MQQQGLERLFIELRRKEDFMSVVIQQQSSGWRFVKVKPRMLWRNPVLHFERKLADDAK
jgi:hypothetical protein